MFHPLVLWIGLRYARARRRNHFISFISLISMAGIALGVAVLITVVAVMNGFEKDVRQGILSSIAHATLTEVNGTLNNWKTAAQVAAAHPEVIAVAPFINGGAMVTEGRNVVGVMVRGILPESEARVAEIGDHVVNGNLDALIPNQQGIILGKALAKKLGVEMGGQVTLVTAREDTQGTDTLPKLSRHTVVGLFEMGMRQYDTGLVLIHLANAARLFGLGERVGGLRLKVTNLYQARRIVHEVAQSLPGRSVVSDWTRQNANFFIALAQQRQMMLIILGLIIFVAAFNIVSTLVMVVTDKAAAIAILRTLGMTPAGVIGVFMVQGSLIGLTGTLAGIVGGVALAFHIEPLVANIETHFGVRFLAADVYPISRLPSDLHWIDVIHIGVVAFTLSLLATLYPAWRAASIRPAEALRHE
ncbi:Lipoprotein-releasing system transmembrane protein LolC [Gammaproteobacteria bacterium]